MAQQAAAGTQEVVLEELSVAGEGRGAGNAAAGFGVPRLKADGYLARDGVSATRTQTPLREVPQTVVVVPAQVLTDAAATRVDTALDLAGVGRANNFGGLGLSEFTIRGLATGEYYRNGFPINRGFPNSPDVASIERIEVLKGPSAFLYGRGDPGGTFNIVTKQPLAERALWVGQQLGSFNAKRTTFDATGPLDADGQVLARLTGAFEDNGSFRDFVYSDRYYLAPVIAWKATPDTTITLEGEFLGTAQPLDRGIVPFNGSIRTLPRSRFLGEPGLAPVRNDNALGQLRIEHRIDPDWVVTAGAQVLGGNIRGLGVGVFGVNQVNPRLLDRTLEYRDLTWSDLDLQLNLAGKFETGPFRHTLLMGLEYDSYRYREVFSRSPRLLADERTSRFPLDPLAPAYGQSLPAITSPVTNFLQDTQSIAGYVQDQIDLTPRLHALAGVRVENLGLVSTNYLPVRPGTVNPANREATVATPRFGLVYDLTDTVSIYGNYAQSFRPNTGTTTTGLPLPFQGGEGLEAGAKIALLDGRLSLDAAVFDIRRTNVATTDPLNVNAFVAAGEIRSRGFDLSVAGYLAPGWRVFGTYTHADAEVTRDQTIPVGTRLANVPTNSLAVQSVYEFQGGDLRGLGLGGGLTYVGARNAGTAFPTFRLPEYTTLNLISYYWITPEVKVYLNVENLLDATYYDRAFQNRYATPGLPRAIMGGVAARF
ncbi:TonB-dependent siderophore receptor [Methylorubrum sp. SB2]|uniref:TonB-dependent siderophore receptor n=1 Tax=Methylorubrum subtropicum TaxID=3138812 RepID=UPI00313E0E3D